MNGIPMSIVKAEPVITRELRDGGIIKLLCSNCKAPLLDIWRVRIEEDSVWKISADCPHCGDRSYEQEIKGGFMNGLFTEYTDVIDVVTGKDSVLFKTAVRQPWKGN